MSCGVRRSLRDAACPHVGIHPTSLTGIDGDHTVSICAEHKQHLDRHVAPSADTAWTLVWADAGPATGATTAISTRTVFGPDLRSALVASLRDEYESDSLAEAGTSDTELLGEFYRDAANQDMFVVRGAVLSIPDELMREMEQHA